LGQETLSLTVALLPRRTWLRQLSTERQRSINKENDIMKTKRILTIATMVFALGTLMTLSAFRGTRKVHAQDQSPPPVNDRISFGMVGITEGQTLRVNVSNFIAPNDSGYPPGPTRVVIRFLNAAGRPVTNRGGEVIRQVVELHRGESTFLDINYSELPPGPSRAQLRAVVTEQPPPVNDSHALPPGPTIVPSVEVINNANARTVFFTGNPGVIRGFNPQPDPPAGD
jgi:hypothetical protein